MMKNAFNFNIFLFLVRSQDFFFFFHDYWSYKKRFDWKDKFNFKMYDVTVHILPNISGSKGN